MKKTGSLVWYKILPAQFGGQKGIALFNKYLAKEISLTVICSRNNEAAADNGFDVLPVLPTGKIQFFSPFVWRKIIKLVKEKALTRLILEHPYYGLLGWWLKKTWGTRIIIHSHNIEAERFRLLGATFWWLLRGYEGWSHRQAHLSLFKTDADREYAISRYRLSPEKCMTVPYGVETPTTMDKAAAQRWLRQQYGIGATDKLLLFAGTLDYAPNAAAVQAIFSALIPQLEKNSGFPFHIIICGRNEDPAFRHLHQQSHPKVTIAGAVPDMAPYFSGTDVFINPVTTTAGIQTKNIDALAHHCTVVCFEQSATGINRTCCGEKMITIGNGDWPAFGEAIIRAAQNNSATPPAFFEQYSWASITKAVAEKINQLP
jgi:polysaccharide biosynthesis protein PslH